MKLYKNLLLTLLVIVIGTTACFDDLNTVPLDDDSFTSANVYSDADNYIKVLAKIYAGLAVTGQQGPAGQADISGIDEGFSSYLRQYWKAQELPTDEAMIAWNDGNIHDYHQQDWDANNEFVTAMYNRIYFQITVCNEFIREASQERLEFWNIPSDRHAEIAGFKEEARFMRALSYWHGLDMFRNVPFVTDEDLIGAFLPKQATPETVFNYIESELKALESTLPAPRQNEYGRADQAAVWMLLAKLYLNAEVYIGQAKYSECVEYCNKIIGAGYTLDANYANLFMADNHTASEIIFPITFDGVNTRTWGGMTFLVHAAVGGTMAPEDFGIDGGWAGIRTTSALVLKFDTSAANQDDRRMLYTDGQSLEINSISQFTDGYAITKYKNLTSTGGQPSNLTFIDTDFPLFRLADAYLMYAEAVLRGGSGGDAATALGYVNALRERAYGSNAGNITQGELNLDFILDERSRELYWECHRRTDLIRYGQLTNGTYNWPWKGGVKEGQPVSTDRDIYPIPSSDLGANPNLTQNPGY